MKLGEYRLQTTMSIDICKGYLEAFACLNEGINHACEYTIERLDGNMDLQTAVVLHLLNSGLRGDQREIELVPMPGDWRPKITTVITRWFFEKDCSPATQGMSSQHNAVIGFINHLAELVGKAEVFQVAGTATATWAIEWEGYAFSNQGNHWLLQFSWTD
jgi:hypothetical protein